MLCLFLLEHANLGRKHLILIYWTSGQIVCHQSQIKLWFLQGMVRVIIVNSHSLWASALSTSSSNHTPIPITVVYLLVVDQIIKLIIHEAMHYVLLSCIIDPTSQTTYVHGIENRKLIPYICVRPHFLFEVTSDCICQCQNYLSWLLLNTQRKDTNY